MVVSIGLFHGLVFLPVLLSIIGPKAYMDTEEQTSQVEDIDEGGSTTDSATSAEVDQSASSKSNNSDNKGEECSMNFLSNMKCSHQTSLPDLNVFE